jgi:cation transport ATPase
MSRNGSGIYSLPAGNPVVTGTVISSSWANTTLTDIANTLTQSVSSDGQTPMTGSLNMNTNGIINLTDPVNAQDAVTLNYLSAGTYTINGGAF